MSRRDETSCCGSAAVAEERGPEGLALPMLEACCGPSQVPVVVSMAGRPGRPPSEETAGPPPRSSGQELPGYRLWPFVEGWLDTPAGPVPRVKTALEAGDVLGRWQMRWGIGRDRYRLAPGLYAVGSPGAASPALVTANYKMTFDAVRRDAAGLDAWLLVLETHGINVWCAAGKGTFGTAEVIRRVQAAGLDRVVEHRRLVLPQLGAPGVSAREVRQGCGFSVVYGPVRSADLRAFFAAGMQATPAMRAVTFGVGERLALTPVELVLSLKLAAWAALGLFVLAGLGPGFYSLSAAWHRGLGGLGALAAALFAGAVVTPVLLPWLPWRAFSAKGAAVGAGVAVLIALAMDALSGFSGFLALLLGVSAGSSYAAMNFTGATPFTSPSGVEREMRRALPWQAGAGALAGVFWLASAF